MTLELIVKHVLRVESLMLRSSFRVGCVGEQGSGDSISITARSELRVRKLLPATMRGQNI